MTSSYVNPVIQPQNLQIFSKNPNHTSDNNNSCEINNNLNFSNNNEINKTLSLFNPKHAATKAELLWCLELIASKQSFRSCFGKKELFNEMFPGSIPKDFSLSPSKAGYLITEALGHR